MKHETDSYGTPLPKDVMLRSGASNEEWSFALVMTSFLLGVSIAMSMGKKVRYDPEAKTATTDEGMIYEHI